MFRQGDVLIIPIAGKLPQGLKPVEREQGRVVLAHGEVTGHAHAIRERNAFLYQEDVKEKPRTFLHIVQPEGALHNAKNSSVGLRHEEHAKVKLKPGLYEVRRQREYTPEEIRNVAD